MTRYAVDETRGELIATWGVGNGDVARVIATVNGARREHLLGLAAALSGLASALWRCYTHPASAEASIEVNTEGWRRQGSRDNFADVVEAIRKPNLPDEYGLMVVNYDPVEESAHRVGRKLHTISDSSLTEAIISEVEAELNAVEQAELGDLSGRAVQAVLLTRADASPVQVAAADAILDRDPLGGNDLFLKLDPVAAAAAAAHWLYAAATVVSEISGVPVAQVVIEADNIEALPHSTPTIVLELLEDGHSPTGVVTGLIREAMAVAEGHATDFKALEERVKNAKELYKRSGAEGTHHEAELRQVELTSLDPQRPGRDMLEDLLTGIRGCRLLYSAYVDYSGPELDDEDDDEDEGSPERANELEEEIDSTFAAEVREEAAAKRHRLGLEPAPNRLPEEDDDVEGVDFNLESDDICERLVEAVLETDQPDIPRDIIQSIADLENEDAGRLLAQLIMRGTKYLVSMREAGLSPDRLESAVHWVGENFGAEYAGPSVAIAALAGQPESQRLISEQLGTEDVTFAQLSDFLKMDLFPAMIWLCSGLVVTIGDGDVDWLRQYR